MKQVCMAPVFLYGRGEYFSRGCLPPDPLPTFSTGLTYYVGPRSTNFFSDLTPPPSSDDIISSKLHCILPAFGMEREGGKGRPYHRPKVSLEIKYPFLADGVKVDGCHLTNDLEIAPLGDMSPNMSWIY